MKVSDTAVYVIRDGKGFDAATGAEVAVPDTAEDVVNNNQMRSELGAALARSGCNRPTPRSASKRSRHWPAIRRRQVAADREGLAAESVPAIKDALGNLRSALLLGNADKAKRLEAARSLAESGTPATKLLLPSASRSRPTPRCAPRCGAALEQIDGRLAWGERLGVVFTGISLGSILLLVALGLAITYGLMGVINMAHGELMMIGAYATYVVQNLFRSHLPEAAFDWYVLAAIPVSFLAAAPVGAVLERSVIRWLYGRPLETLLATWGISLILMQAVRTLFGAQNVPVENPAWLSGGVEVMSNLTLPYNRIAIVVFAVLVLAGVAALIAHTRLGLFVRGVTQNRRMAACMGVNTARIDTYAFALGSGIAGLAGCALSQVGNVGPDLGQGYIVDSFMVVVLGGVGQLAGTVYAALGLGVLNKLLEGWQGAVLAKIMVLVFIVIFIQKRPQGIFAMKGRSAEA